MTFKPMLASHADVNRLVTTDERRPGLDRDDAWCYQQKCLMALAPILTDRGWVPCRYLTTADRVIASDGQYRDILKITRSSGRNSVVRIRPTIGLDVELTPDHQVLTETGWMPAGDVTPDTTWLSIPVPRLSSGDALDVMLDAGHGYTKRLLLDEETMWFCGLWVGDGSTATSNSDMHTKGRVSVVMNRRDQHVVKRVVAFFERMGLDPHVHARSSSQADIVYAVDLPFARWLLRSFRRPEVDGYSRLTPESKTIPPWFDFLSDDVFAAFTAGYVAADGYTSPWNTSMATVSSSLAGLLYRQFLARRLPASIKRGLATWTHNGVRKQRPYYTLRLLTTRRHLRLDGDRWLARVKAVSRVPIRRSKSLYDLTVEGVPDFLSAFTVHNCNGDRVLVAITLGQVDVFGRDGQRSQWKHKFTTRAHQAAYAALAELGVYMVVLDGELMPDGVMQVFDLVTLESGPPPRVPAVLGSDPFRQRLRSLTALFEQWAPPATLFRLLPTAIGTEAKLELALDCVRRSTEGVIARRLDGTYRPGVRSKHMLKLKFIHDADLVVMDIGFEGRDNVVLGAYPPDAAPIITPANVAAALGVDEVCPAQPIEVGRASAHGKGSFAKDDVVVVRYNYMSRDGRLVGPRILRKRTDKAAIECSTEQLFYSQEVPVYEH